MAEPTINLARWHQAGITPKYAGAASISLKFLIVFSFIFHSQTEKSQPREVHRPWAHHAERGTPGRQVELMNIMDNLEACSWKKQPSFYHMFWMNMDEHPSSSYHLVLRPAFGAIPEAFNGEW